MPAGASETVVSNYWLTEDSWEAGATVVDAIYTADAVEVYVRPGVADWYDLLYSW